MKYSFEIVKGETDYYRIHDENDNAVGGCYHPDNARLLVDALNATHRARAIGVAFVEANRMRALRWHNGNLGNWSAAEWGNAIAGECGEFCNVAKKILRFDKDMQQRAVVNDEEGARDARRSIDDKSGA